VVVAEALVVLVKTALVAVVAVMVYCLISQELQLIMALEVVVATVVAAPAL
jgi:hypothetical protein